MALQNPGRAIRDEAEARACIAAMEQGGLSLVAYATANALSSRSLNRWRGRLTAGREAESKASPVPRLDAKRARAMLAEWQAAGGDLATFCRNRGLSVDSMYAWKARLTGKRAFAPREPRMVELVREPPPVQPSAARYELVVGGVRVIVGDDFREETLRRLVAAVSPC